MVVVVVVVLAVAPVGLPQQCRHSLRAVQDSRITVRMEGLVQHVLGAVIVFDVVSGAHHALLAGQRWGPLH